MAEAWRPAPGQVALIEVEGVEEALTGIVVSRNGADVTIDLGASPRPPDPTQEILASFFAPDALYRVRGKAQRHEEQDAVIDLTVSGVERVQRRSNPRARVALGARVRGRDGGGAVDGRTLDIGPGGCRVLTDRPCPSSDDGVEVEVTTEDGAAIVAAGELLQTTTTDEGYEARIAFLSLDDEATRRIGALVELS